MMSSEAKPAPAVPIIVRRRNWITGGVWLLCIGVYIVPAVSKLASGVLGQMPAIALLWMVANPLTPIGKLVVIALLLLLAPVYWIAMTWFPAWRGGDPGVSKFPADSEFSRIEFDLSSRRSRIGFFVYYYLLPPIRYVVLFLLCGAVTTPFRG